MARKTKEEAELTRKKLIKSALLLFSEQGVAHTTITDIAKKAEVTKGAFYWHFKNRLEVFDAIIDEYSTPIEDQADVMLKEGQDPVESIFNTVEFFFSKVESSPELIALYDVSYFKCEYTDEFASRLKFEQEQLLKTKDDFAKVLAKVEASVWPNKSDDLIEQISMSMVDMILGTFMRWIGSRSGSLTSQVRDSMAIVLKGAGIKFN
ncbi:hypothetical protein A7985_08880 [Pseudoalteromonas luteoviolacea]|uniref:HTH tetR-type domain-containing protein n=1 Tax=Pseudoalteromonas luteoviolacea TaxID=43657 RepID=A0A1C0TRM1_9GAMM|nr:TetR family transcriptional regulator [Pseudoalteromonas luteoviolacea]OCQ21913.1 hypothetical protein A7985_08880 [Pseudoalteromonas luteoviolacea]